jgi:uncharacterized membrane protein YgcG
MYSGIIAAAFAELALAAKVKERRALADRAFVESMRETLTPERFSEWYLEHLAKKADEEKEQQRRKDYNRRTRAIEANAEALRASRRCSPGLASSIIGGAIGASFFGGRNSEPGNFEGGGGDFGGGGASGEY